MCSTSSADTSAAKRSRRARGFENPLDLVAARARRDGQRTLEPPDQLPSAGKPLDPAGLPLVATRLALSGSRDPVEVDLEPGSLQGDPDGRAIVVGEQVGAVVLLIDAHALRDQAVAERTEMARLTVHEDTVEIEDHGSQPQCHAPEICWHSSADATRLTASLIGKYSRYSPSSAPCHPGASAVSLASTFLLRATRIPPLRSTAHYRRRRRARRRIVARVSFRYGPTLLQAGARGLAAPG